MRDPQDHSQLHTVYLGGNGYMFEIVSKTKLADKVSFAERYYTFTYGIFDISNVLFFVSAAFVFLFLTVRVVEKRRYS